MTTEPHGPQGELFELDAATCASLLRTQRVGRLVTAGETPSIVPVNYVAVDGAIVFHVAAGPHADRLVGLHAVFEVDDIDDRTRSGWSVIAHGRVSDHVPGHPHDGTWPSLEPWVPGDRDCRLALFVDSLTGRLVRGPTDDSAHDAAAYL